MAKPLRVMGITIGATAVLIVGGAFGYHEWKAALAPHPATPNTPAQIAQLLVTVPELTTNTQNGLVQLTVALEANNAPTKQELQDLMPEVENAINTTTLGFSNQELRSNQGLSIFQQAIQKHVDTLLPKGEIAHVYFPSIVTQ
ncbi:hypothetical protein D2Q93_14430 [Alicyclobacillaceae bacterium I2511]|nr:hypothetical protein D2Q93_14430 [Alicyclobacillaceae bacterium I2511]